VGCDNLGDASQETYPQPQVQIFVVEEEEVDHLVVVLHQEEEVRSRNDNQNISQTFTKHTILAHTFNCGNIYYHCSQVSQSL